MPQPVRDYLLAAEEAVMRIHRDEPPGDILLFLTGAEEIDSPIGRCAGPAAGAAAVLGAAAAQTAAGVRAAATRRHPQGDRGHQCGRNLHHHRRHRVRGRSRICEEQDIQPALARRVAASERHQQGQCAATRWARRAHPARHLLPPVHGGVVPARAGRGDAPGDSAFQSGHRGAHAEKAAGAGSGALRFHGPAAARDFHARPGDAVLPARVGRRRQPYPTGLAHGRPAARPAAEQDAARVGPLSLQRRGHQTGRHAVHTNRVRAAAQQTGRSGRRQTAADERGRRQRRRRPRPAGAGVRSVFAPRSEHPLVLRALSQRPRVTTCGAHPAAAGAHAAPPASAADIARGARARSLAASAPMCAARVFYAGGVLAPRQVLHHRARRADGVPASEHRRAAPTGLGGVSRVCAHHPQLHPHRERGAPGVAAAAGAALFRRARVRRRCVPAGAATTRPISCLEMKYGAGRVRLESICGGRSSCGGIGFVSSATHRCQRLRQRVEHRVDVGPHVGIAVIGPTALAVLHAGAAFAVGEVAPHRAGSWHGRFGRWPQPFGGIWRRAATLHRIVPDGGTAGLYIHIVCKCVRPQLDEHRAVRRQQGSVHQLRAVHRYQCMGVAQHPQVAVELGARGGVPAGVDHLQTVSQRSLLLLQPVQQLRLVAQPTATMVRRAAVGRAARQERHLQRVRRRRNGALRRYTCPGEERLPKGGRIGVGVKEATLEQARDDQVLHAQPPLRGEGGRKVVSGGEWGGHGRREHRQHGAR
eukprot:ctg_728.g360